MSKDQRNFGFLDAFHTNAPGSTKVLMLTDGLIDSVDNMVLSELSNMSVLALSNNAISSIMENAFQNLSFLTTLLLDHNRISSQSLNSSMFSWLHRLETLQLGNNNLNDIDSSWFQSSRSLKMLQLEGNLLTGLNSTTFAHADLRNLETLDLSNNLIVYLGRDSFRGLPHLCRLDLSRNHLRSGPDAFSYLSWLSVLNLDLNRWSCTCELRELASFLKSYIQAPEKVLYNGQRMVCVNADNAAVQAVLELTDANCAPPNRNLTVEVVAKTNNTFQQYIRNVAIAIVFSFLGRCCAKFLPPAKLLSLSSKSLPDCLILTPTLILTPLPHLLLNLPILRG
uniref:Leucine rich repeat containing 53 n=1 Tax=Sinocyclocheilus grahami TaxID=75366 RepID=A0A672MBT9_SINGR